MVLMLMLISLMSFVETVDSSNKELIVNISLFEPLVMKNDQGEYCGFDIDLWEAIAEELNWRFQYNEVAFQNIFLNLQNKKSDIGLAGITIKANREEYVDFSHHYLDSGLLILVPWKNEVSFLSTITSIFTIQNIKILLYFLLFIVICGILAWASEIGEDAFDDRPFPGIFEGIYWAIVTCSTVGFGDFAPKKWLGRILAILLIFCGIAFYGVVIAQLSSSFTMQKLEFSISCPKDLRGKIVGTKAGTTSVEILEELGAKVVVFPYIQDAYRELTKPNSKIDAVVFDAPNVRYYAANEGKGKAAIVGDLFDKQNYGIALQEDSQLRENINRVLLKLQESEVYDKIYERWFGAM